MSTKHGSRPVSVLPNQTNVDKISRLAFLPFGVQVANALIKSKKHPESTTRYRCIKARCSYKKAIIAICRLILTAI